MKIYDISQEILSCEVYPGDKAPTLTPEMRMSCGDLYNLSSLEMGAHNGTHIDAPFHFYADGDTVEKIPLERTVGYCYVTEQNADIGDVQAAAIVAAASRSGMGAERRILIKGRGVVTASAARVFADADVYLIGVESQTVGPEHAPMEVHKILLGQGSVLLEGIRLADICEGAYFLNAAPLSLRGADGAPCRAILIKE